MNAKTCLVQIEVELPYRMMDCFGVWTVSSLHAEESVSRSLSHGKAVTSHAGLPQRNGRLMSKG